MRTLTGSALAVNALGCNKKRRFAEERASCSVCGGLKVIAALSSCASSCAMLQDALLFFRISSAVVFPSCLLLGQR